jgi:ABC-2 type transport system permease protein
MHSDSAKWVQTQLAAAPAATDPYGGNPYNQSSPGILVMFAIFGLVSSAQILVQERKTRTLERMRTTSLSPAEIVGGHFLAMFLLTLLQQILLVAFGQVALGVNYLSAPWGILGVMVTLALCVASMGLLIGVIAKQEEQVILFSLVAMFVFSGLGGVWFPLEGAGQAFATIGRLTPTAWAMKGFQNILIRGLDSASVLLPSGILLAYAACFFILAVWRFRKID